MRLPLLLLMAAAVSVAACLPTSSSSSSSDVCSIAQGSFDGEVGVFSFNEDDNASYTFKSNVYTASTVASGTESIDQLFVRFIIDTDQNITLTEAGATLTRLTFQSTKCDDTGFGVTVTSFKGETDVPEVFDVEGNVCNDEGTLNAFEGTFDFSEADFNDCT